MAELSFLWLPYEQCKSDFIAFRNRNRTLSRDEHYFDWRFLQRPARAQTLIVWATVGEERVGSLSLVPHDFFVNGRTASLGILGDISVLSQYRGRGVARRMFEYLAGLDRVRVLDGCVVLPNEGAASPLEKAGWKNVSMLERYVVILDVRATLERFVKSKAVSNVFSPAINALLKLSYNELMPGYTGDYSGEQADGFDNRFDDLWGAVCKKGMALGVRNREYLNWRYAAHPHVKFNAFTMVNGDRLCGYIIYRIDGGAVYVADILALDDDRCKNRLLSLFTGYIRKNRIASSIHLSVNRSNALGLPLGKFNFIRRPDFQRFMVLPSCANPCGGVFTDGGRWFLTAGDKDV